MFYVIGAIKRQLGVNTDMKKTPKMDITASVCAISNDQLSARPRAGAMWRRSDDGRKAADGW